MPEENDTLKRYFSRLGLSGDTADIYSALQTYGPQSISELSRTSGVSRIHIYRLLDELKTTGIIEVEVRYKRSILHAAPFSSIQVMLSKKDQELQDLQKDYAMLATKFADTSIRSANTRVQFYEGMDGVKQMLWNQTKSKSEQLGILYDNMQHKTNLAFFERWVRQCNEQDIHFRGIVGDRFIRTQRHWYATHTNERLTHWQARYISSKVFPIVYSVVTYDDIVIHSNWNTERVFGIEMRSAEIARMQRQFFELLWQQATPVDDLTGNSSE